MYLLNSLLHAQEGGQLVSFERTDSPIARGSNPHFLVARRKTVVPRPLKKTILPVPPPP